MIASLMLEVPVFSQGLVTGEVMVRIMLPGAIVVAVFAVVVSCWWAACLQQAGVWWFTAFG